MRFGFLAITALFVLAPSVFAAKIPRHGLVEEKTAEELGALLAARKTTSVEVTRTYIARIEALNPTLRAVVSISPNALEQARASDLRRREGKLLGPLDGLPILVKDNIETKELPTTAGSLALRDNWTRRDAPIVAMIRAQGAVILGKTNMTEWANGRSTLMILGWSAVGGMVRNPYAFDRTACGSSSGSGAAVAASFAPLALGTETDASITCPSAMNGLVGLKPTLGMASRTYIVPLAHSQDTPGPMAKTVRDVAMLFTAMVGSDPDDAATIKANDHRRNYTEGLTANALQGMRIGYWTPPMEKALAAKFDQALDELRKAGATLVEVKLPQHDGLTDAESLVFLTETKIGLDAYLATTPSTVKTRSLADVIAFNEANKSLEMPFSGQERFLEAAKTRGSADAEYLGARAKSLRLTGDEGIDAMLKAGDVQLLVSPSFTMPWLNDPIYGDRLVGPVTSNLPAVAGYPHLTVPMGLASGLPVGLSFIGPAWSDYLVLQAGYAYEQQTKARVPPKYLPSVEADLEPRVHRLDSGS